MYTKRMEVRERRQQGAPKIAPFLLKHQASESQAMELRQQGPEILYQNAESSSSGTMKEMKAGLL